MRGASTLPDDHSGEPTAPDVEFDVPDGEEPAARCPYCDRPFRSERLRTFHVGADHPEECTDEERAAFEAEREDEEFDLFTFHVKATVTVLVTFFVFAYFYAFVWSG